MPSLQNIPFRALIFLGRDNLKHPDLGRASKSLKPTALTRSQEVWCSFMRFKTSLHHLVDHWDVDFLEDIRPVL